MKLSSTILFTVFSFGIYASCVGTEEVGSSRVKRASPVSQVTITVGDKNGFSYTLSGVTHTNKRISISGTYLNDLVNRRGATRLFLVVDTGVAAYSLRPSGGQLDVYIRNYNYEEFYFTVYCPQPVTADDLYEQQYNSTAVLITGPSRDFF